MVYLLFFALCLLGEAALHALLVNFVERPRLHKESLDLLAEVRQLDPLRLESSGL